MTPTEQMIALPTREQIERRAYQIYVDRGAEDGQALTDWLKAENELMMEMAKPVMMTAPEPVRAARKAASSMVS